MQWRGGGEGGAQGLLKQATGEELVVVQCVWVLGGRGGGGGGALAACGGEGLLK